MLGQVWQFVIFLAMLGQVRPGYVSLGQFR